MPHRENGKRVYNHHTFVVNTTPEYLKKRITKMLQQYGGIVRIWQEFFAEYDLLK